MKPCAFYSYVNTVKPKCYLQLCKHCEAQMLSTALQWNNPSTKNNYSWTNMLWNPNAIYSNCVSNTEKITNSNLIDKCKLNPLLWSHMLSTASVNTNSNTNITLNFLSNKKRDFPLNHIIHNKIMKIYAFSLYFNLSQWFFNIFSRFKEKRRNKKHKRINLMMSVCCL